MSKPRGALLCALPTLLLLLCQCASQGPKLQRAVTLQQGQLLRVSLVQVQSGVTLALQNASYSRASDVYSDGSSDRHVKVIDDEEMQKLLDVLGGQGMFDRAAPRPVNDARELIAVQQGERRWVWSRRAGLSDDLEAFGNARTCITAVYNSTTAFHKAELSGRDLDAEKARVEQAGAAARQKAEQAEKGPPK